MGNVCNKCGSLKTDRDVFLGGPQNFNRLDNGEMPGEPHMKRTFLTCGDCGASMGTFRHRI
jgi:hypothetical protein